MQSGASGSISIPPFWSPASDLRWARDVWSIGTALLLLVAWEVSGLDLPLQHIWGDSRGFPWRDHWLTSGVLHGGARALAWVVLGMMLVSLKWPLAFARSLSKREQLWMIGTVLFCVAVIPLLKRVSTTSCPWALAEFGGGLVSYVPHWALGQYDGGPGGCFPSGHASTAFAFLGGWFVLRDRPSCAGKLWLAATLLCGLVLSWSQMVRGAHFLSHSLWTAWLCWAFTAFSYHALGRWRTARNAKPLSALA